MIKITNDTSTLNGALQELGETMATNLVSMGVSDADVSDGLTTLAGKILDIAPSVGGITPSVSIDISKTPSTVYAHDSVLLSAKVNADYDDTSQVDVDLKGVLQGATVTFKNNGIVIGTAVTGLDGIATYTMTNVVTGNYSITAHFDGSNTDYESATSSALTFTVNHNYSLAFSQASYTASGGSATVECTLLDNGVAVANETITLSDGSTTYSSITNNNGVASFSLTGLASGTTTATATWSTLTATCTIINLLFYDKATTGEANSNYTKTNAGIVVSTDDYGTTVSCTAYADAFYYENVLIHGDFEAEFVLVDGVAYSAIAFLNTSKAMQWNLEQRFASDEIGLWINGSRTSNHLDNRGSIITIKRIGSTYSVYVDGTLLTTGSITSNNGYLGWKTHSHSNRSITFKNFSISAVNYIINDDCSTDNSSTLFGDHISLRNGGTCSVTYDSTEKCYVITNTKGSAEAFLEYLPLRGITSSFKLTIYSKTESSRICPIGAFYYENDNNWGGAKDESTNVWVATKTNGSYSEYNKGAGEYLAGQKHIDELIYDATTNQLTIKKYNASNTLVLTQTLSVPITLDSNVKWGNSITWDNNAVRKIYNIKAEYI